MARKRDPRSREAVADVLKYIREMSGEELQGWIDQLSKAKPGVYDPWSEENWPMERDFLRSMNGQTLSTDDALPTSDPVTPEASPR